MAKEEIKLPPIANNASQKDSNKGAKKCNTTPLPDVESKEEREARERHDRELDREKFVERAEKEKREKKEKELREKQERRKDEKKKFKKEKKEKTAKDTKETEKQVNQPKPAEKNIGPKSEPKQIVRKKSGETKAEKQVDRAKPAEKKSSPKSEPKQVVRKKSGDTNRKSPVRKVDKTPEKVNKPTENKEQESEPDPESISVNDDNEYTDVSDTEMDDAGSKSPGRDRRSSVRRSGRGPRLLVTPKTPRTILHNKLHMTRTYNTYKLSLPSLTLTSRIVPSAKRRRKANKDNELVPLSKTEDAPGAEKRRQKKRDKRTNTEEDAKRRKREKAQERKDRSHWEDYRRRNERGWVKIENVVRDKLELYDTYVEAMEEKLETQREQMKTGKETGDRRMKRREEKRITKQVTNSQYAKRWAWYYANFRPPLTKPPVYNSKAKYWRQMMVWTC